MLTRRQTLALAGLSALAATTARAAEGAKTLRIGWQKNGVLALAKRTGALEKRLEAAGIAVTWHEFPSGPPLLEALGSGAIDFGTTGDIPPIFAQTARGDLLYVAALPAPGSASAILVKKDGPIKTLADLKGRTVAFVKGSSAHNVAVSALAKADLTLNDVTVASLSPADAAAAFATGRIDAWSIWDPYFAIAEKDPETRVLTTAEGIVDSYSYFLANGAYTKANAAVIKAVVDELGKVADWSQTHLNDTVAALSEITGIAREVTRVSVTRAHARFAVLPVSEEVIRVQQKTADTFFEAKLIPRKLDIRSIVWIPPVG